MTTIILKWGTLKGWSGLEESSEETAKIGVLRQNTAGRRWYERSEAGVS